MGYSQNTITSANAANDFVTILDGLLTAEGWETVETLTPSGLFRNRVYKSSGASNLCGYDWYIAVCWTVTGTENYVRVIAFEKYDIATHVASGLSGTQVPPFNSSPATRVARSAGIYTITTLALNTLAVTPSATTALANDTGTSLATSNIMGFQTLIPSSAFGYWASVTLDHVALWTTVTTNSNNAVMSSLIIDDDYAANSLYSHTPVVTISTTSCSLSSGMIGTTPTSTVYLANHWTISGNLGAKLPALSDTYFPAYAWKPYFYLDYLAQGSANPTPLTAINDRVTIGQVPDYLSVWGGSVGDTITVSGATYVLTGPLLGSAAAVTSPTLALLVE